jgi:hypothetical protein
MNAAGEPIVRDAGQLSEEDRSKDEFFVRLAHVAEAMIAAHGKEFAMGALILTARFIAEGKPLTKAGNTMTPRSADSSPGEDGGLVTESRGRIDEPEPAARRSIRELKRRRK